MEVEQIPESEDTPSAVETLLKLRANFAGRAPILEQVLQIVLGVRNSWQHGRAACAAINISGADHLIRIAVMDDDGVGFSNSEQPPWAIASRVAEYGGRLKVGGADRNGAHLEIEIPAA